jgi:hypothetical protein
LKALRLSERLCKFDDLTDALRRYGIPQTACTTKELKAQALEKYQELILAREQGEQSEFPKEWLVSVDSNRLVSMFAGIQGKAGKKSQNCSAKSNHLQG